MPAAILDFDLPPDHPIRQILTVIEAHPEVREPLLRALLTEDFLALPSQVKDLAGQVGGLREDFEGFREETREQFGAVNKRLDKNSGQLDEMNSRLDENTRHLGEHSGQMDEMSSRLDENTQRLDEHSGRLNEMSSRLDEHSGRLDEMSSRLDENTQRLDEHSGRLDEMSSRLDENTQRLDEHSGRLDEMSSRLDENTQRLDENTQRLDENIRLTRSIQGSVGVLRGNSYEDLCRREIAAILDGWLELPVLADRGRINDLLGQHRHNDLITRQDYLDSIRPDIIVRAKDDQSQTDSLAIVEVSITFNQDDLETAARRASIISGVTGVLTKAFVVTHHAWPEDMNEVAQQLGVTIIQHDAPEYADL